MLQYDLFYSENKVGTVEVCVDGLYYSVECQCRKFTDAVCRLAVTSEQGSAEIGVLIPDGLHMTLFKRIPKKTLGTKIGRFYLHHKADTNKAITVPADPNKPFAYITELDHVKIFIDPESAELQLMINR